jgi:hypothetical protein
MTQAHEYLIKAAMTKTALFNINLMIPKPMAAAMMVGMEPQREPPSKSDNELENYVEMPVFEPLASLRRKRQSHRRVLRAGG